MMGCWNVLDLIASHHRRCLLASQFSAHSYGVKPCLTGGWLVVEWRLRVIFYRLPNHVGLGTLFAWTD